MKMIRLISLVIVLLSISACNTVGEPTPDVDGITRYEPSRTLENILMTNQKGDQFSWSSLQGDYVLVSFGYTNCPDICPLNLANYKQIKRLLDQKSEQVSFVFVTVDGKRDTPARLMQYIGAFDSEFIGLTSDKATVDKLIKQYNGSYQINDYGGLRENYTVDHTATLFLLDQQGNWLRSYSYGMDYEQIAQDINSLLQ